MWHPGGRPSCWCRDRRARRDTRGGVAPVGCDFIAAQEAVAIRVSRPGCPSRKIFSVAAVGVSVCAPGQGCPPDLLVRNAAGWLAAFSDRSDTFVAVS
ncbi:hypothetical protein Taro_047299 [Colocasia esculenta]|uniref:Uncharacterized protein n=1 Tax=Colocasia esculenta TaxID=4460 RepID=A0A843WVU3_COLES|nr:hypothetical protein [Colocasia esculenta]